MTHVAEEFKKDSDFWNNMDVTRDFAINQVQQNRNYFIGFCTHKEETNDAKIYTISTPKYGMLFRPKPNGYDSLYIGPFDEKGLPSTDKTKLSGLNFFDLDFSDEPQNLNSKSFYRGQFLNGLFEGRGELLITKKED
jgi:hypothetical protein